MAQDQETPTPAAAGEDAEKYKKLAGNTVIFAISNFASKLLTFIIQPLLTHVMKEPDVVGVAKLASQCANLLIPFVSMGMSNAIIRFGLDKNHDKRQVFTNGLLTIFCGYGLLLLLLPVTRLIPTLNEYLLLIYIYVLTSCLRSLCTQFVRSRQMNRLIALDGVLCTLATLSFYMLYLAVLNMGATGYLLAIICGDLCSSIFLFITAKLGRYVDFRRLNKQLWLAMLRFSIPMIPAQISFWVINASDLFFVKYMCDPYGGLSGDSWSGLLSTGYWMPTILNTLGLIFYEAWQLSAVTEETDRERFFSNIFRMYSGILFCCAAGIIWLCQPLMHLFRENFYDAWQFVPFLTIAAIFTCFNQFFNSIYVVYKRTTNALYTMLAGAVANCIMNYLFIRLWGPVGATFASFLGLFLVFVLRAVNTRGLLVVDFRVSRVAVMLGSLICESLVLLCGVPFARVITTLITAFIIYVNWDCVWGIGSLLIIRVLGRRGRKLVDFCNRIGRSLTRKLKLFK